MRKYLAPLAFALFSLPAFAQQVTYTPGAAAFQGIAPFKPTSVQINGCTISANDLCDTGTTLFGSTLTYGGNITLAFGTTGAGLIGSAFTQTDNTTGVGTVTNGYGSVIGATTFATGTNAVTITNGDNVFIAAPVAGAHTTLTNTNALGLGGRLDMTNNPIGGVSSLISNNSSGYQLVAGGSSCTVPTVVPNRSTTTTGMGGTSPALCFIVSGADDMDFGSTTAATWTVPSGAHVSLLDATIKLTGLANSTANAIVCWTNATGLLTENTAANCVASLEEYKIISRNIDGAEAHHDIQALKPFWFKYKKDFSCRAAHCAPDPQDIYDLPGLGAHYTSSVDPRLGSYSNGKLASVQYAQLTAVLAANEQYMQAEISSLTKKVREQQHEIAVLKRK